MRLMILYGPTGSGKTRLLNSLAEGFVAQRGLKVFHSSVHEIAEDIVDNLMKGTMRHYRESLLDYRIFLIDNMFVVGGNPATAREIFSLFRMLIDMRRPVIIASDIEPSTLAFWAGANGDMVKESHVISMN